MIVGAKEGFYYCKDNNQFYDSQQISIVDGVYFVREFMWRSDRLWIAERIK